MIRELLLKILGGVDKRQVEEKLASQTDLVSEKNKEISKLQSSNKELHMAIESTAHKYYEKSAIPKKELEEAKKKAKKFETEKRAIENDSKARLQGLIDELKKANETIKCKNEKIDQVCSELEKVKEENKTLLHSQESKKRTVDEKKSKSEAETDDEDAELKYAQGKLQQLIRELSETRKELNDAKKKIKQKEQTQEQQKLADNNKDKQQTISPKPAPVENKSSTTANGTGSQKIEDDKKFSKLIPDLKFYAAASNSSKDLPSPETIYRPTIRNIKAVIDLERNDEFIKADDFFSRSDEEISKVSRHLEMCAQLGKASMICACCHTPVKISKRTTSKGEGLFFTHCNHQVDCQWRPVHASGEPSFSEDPYTPLNMAQQAKVNAFKRDKEIISNALTSDRSKRLGINAEIDVYPVNNISHISKRRTDFFCTFRNGVKLAINLQTSDDYNSEIVSKDIFYKLNDYFILWVFGAGEENYDYLNWLVYKNTLYANKRNVFIFDKDAREATQREGTLVLKCNYLDPDNNWHYRQKVTGNNGIPVTLDCLNYDDKNTFRPYYHNANIEYFKTYSDEEALAKNEQENREQLQKDVEKNWKLEQEYVSKESNEAEEQPTGTTDSSSAMPQASDPTEVQANVPKNEEGTEASECEEETQPSIDPKTGYDELIELKDGFAKFKQNGKWGILKDGAVIIDPYYDEIGSFRNRFIGIYDGKIRKIVHPDYGDKTEELEYHYRSTVKAKYVNENDKNWVFEIRGDGDSAFGFISKKNNSSIPGLLNKREEYSLCILSISYMNNNTYDLYLGLISLRLQNRQYAHTDKDSDFEKGKSYEGKIHSKRKNKFYALMDNGKETYFTKGVVGNKSGSLHIGARIKLKKIDFDKRIEKTIWEIEALNESSHSIDTMSIDTEKRHKFLQMRQEDILGHLFVFKVEGTDIEGRYKLISVDYAFTAFLDKKDAKNFHYNNEKFRARVMSEDKSGDGYMVIEV